MAVLIKICICTIIGVLVAFRSGQCSNILVILPTAVKSHLIIFESILQVLATEHNITFYSVFPLNKHHTNITEHRFVPSYTPTDIKSLMQRKLNKDPQIQFFSILKQFSVKHFNYVLSQDTFQQLINSTEKYELFITSNVLAEPFFKFSHVLNASLVQVSLALPHPWTNTAIGNDNNLAHDIYFLSKDLSTNFLSRITNFINHIYVWLYYEWLHLPHLESNIQKHFPQNTPTMKQLARQTQGVLLNIVSPMGYAHANSPNVYEFGGLQCHPPTPLSTELEDFISGSGQHGFIYFSLGGTISDLVLSAKIKTGILNVFRKLPQRVLWKLDEDIEDIPMNVRTAKWFPQQDILGHKQIKLFITQGGILSLQEAVYHSVPVLNMPLIYDQFINSYITKLKGYGRVLKLNQFTEELFQSNIEEILLNKKYTNKIKQTSEAMRDHCDGNADRLKRFINYLIKYKDLSPLRPIAKPQSQIHLMQLDIYAFILCVLTICFIIIKYVIKKLYKSFTNLYYFRLNKAKVM